MTAFNIAMGRANFAEHEREAGFCQYFIESLSGAALTWFSRLSENSVDSFHDLSAAFLKHRGWRSDTHSGLVWIYSVFRVMILAPFGYL